MFFRLTMRGMLDFRLHPWAQLFTLVAVTMVTLLAGIFLMLLYNVNQELLINKGQVQFQIYWTPGTDTAKVEGQWRELRQMEGLKELDTYSPKRALMELAEAMDTTDFSWLEGRNPLPASAMAKFEIPPDKENFAQNLLSRLEALPGVEKVHYNPMQIDLARGWMAVTRTVVWPMIGFLGLVVALTVGNTIKLSLLTRRDEVEILALVGAKPWYIRWPLLVGGAVLGLLGGALSLGLLKLAQVTLQKALYAPPLFFRVEFLPVSQAAALVASVVLVCVASSWVAVRR